MLGCAHARENIPTYHWTDDQTAIREMAARARRVRTVSATCLLTLTQPDGQSVRLDAALALSLPDQQVRIRAWKFNQAVFDLTLTRSGLWLEMPRDRQRPQKVLPASIGAAQLARAMSLFGGRDVDDPAARVMDSGGSQFRIRTPLPHRQSLVAHVNRSTLAVRNYQLLDARGIVRFRMTLGRYMGKGGIIWPMHLSAYSSAGRIDMEFQQVEFNVALPPRAFVPPRGAGKMP